MELYYGAYKSQQITGNISKIKTLEAALEIIPTEASSSEIFGMLKSKLEKKGQGLDGFDLTFVTNNQKHFQRIEGLKLENWASAS